MTELASADEAWTVRTTDAGTAEAIDGTSVAPPPAPPGPAVGGAAAEATVAGAGFGAVVFWGAGRGFGCCRAPGRTTVLTPPGARSPGTLSTFWQVSHRTLRPANSSRAMID